MTAAAAGAKPVTGANRATALWLERRGASWRELETELTTLEGRGSVSVEQASTVLRGYPELARDVALSRSLAPGSPLTRQLQRLYGRVHRVLFKAPHSLRRELSHILRVGAAESFAALRWHIVSVTLGFILAGCAGWWLVASFPELATLFASEAMIATVQSGELWTDGLLNVTPSSLLSVGIFTNNIVVTLTAVSLGALYGLGTIYIIGLNGLMIGGVFAFTAQYGLAGRLFEFIAAHGFVELSVIAIAGAMGLYIGEALARPGHLSRIDSFRAAVGRCGPLLVVCVVFLVGAGLIEGYVSPDDRFSLTMRLIVGLGYWVLFLLVLVHPWLQRLAGPGNTLKRDAAP